MDYKKYFLEIIDFLSPYQDILLKEPLDHFDLRKKSYPKDWISLLAGKTDQEHYRFIHFHDTLDLGGELEQFQKKIKELSERFPHIIYEEREFPSWALWKVGLKKQHEIAQLCSYIDALKPQSLVDIGGGIGHLARTLAHYYKIPCTTIDSNKEFQKLGLERAKKYPLPEGAAKLDFHHAEFEFNLLEKIDHDLSIGLHTCGPLAVEHLKGHRYQNKSLINFGCCYHKLDEDSFPLSQFARDQLKFTFTNEAFTLATRSHYGADFAQFNKTKIVKKYRFTFQLLLQKYYDINDFIPVGSSVNSTYKSDFAAYARERLEHLGLPVDHTDKELNEFSINREIVQKVQQIYLCNIIRWRFGRLLELLIILDRALWLQEQGKDVEIKAMFDPGISPRNLAIIS